jgi:hypothetical protein
MRTIHVVQGSGAVVFWIDSRGVLRVVNVLWVLGVCSQPHELESMDMQCCSGMDMCYWILRGSILGKTWSWS